jgi:hypothetical protein
VPERSRSAILAGIVFVAIVAGGTDLRFVSMLFHDHAALRQAFAIPPASRRNPEYERFLAEVARRTEAGSAIAIVFPPRQWERGYAFAYYRASYVLAGRRVLPLVDPDDSVHLERIGSAHYVASWQVPAPELEQVWSGHGGALLRGGR